jgi:hypothetical protein
LFLTFFPISLQAKVQFDTITVVANGAAAAAAAAAFGLDAAIKNPKRSFPNDSQ